VTREARQEMCRRHRLEKQQFQALGFSGEVTLTVAWSEVAPYTANPTATCVQRRSGVRIRPGRRLQI
jgi:hypothetical protein